MNRKVLAILANVKQFRVPFYMGLVGVLKKNNIDFKIAYSDPGPIESSKLDSVDLSSDLGLKVPRTFFLGERILVQRVPISELNGADLVIAVQSNGYVLNYPLLLSSKLGIKRMAFWGHAYNHQSDATTFRERVRKFIVQQPDWWFAYTAQTAGYLAGLGFPKDRITTVNNAIDTTGLIARLDALTSVEVLSLRKELDIPVDAIVGLYCGSLYDHKKISFLLDSGQRIASNLSKFYLIVAGAGPDAVKLEDAVPMYSWLRYVGPQFGAKKAILFKIADVFLNPGLVGLGILDSFSAGLPFITTDIPIHSPEISYLEAGSNGILTPFDAAIYSAAVISLLSDPVRLAMMRREALSSARKYTVEHMIANVSGGIIRCLEADPLGQK